LSKHRVEKCLKLLKEYFASIGLQVNGSKTQVMIISKKLTKISLTLDNLHIESQESLKLLGVLVDRSLSFDTQMTEVGSKFNSIAHLFIYLPRQARRRRAELFHQTPKKAIRFCIRRHSDRYQAPLGPVSNSPLPFPARPPSVGEGFRDQHFSLESSSENR
jgi:hypothetical protein